MIDPATGASGIGKVLADQVRAMLDEQVLSHTPSYSAVVDLETIERTPSGLRAHHPVNLEALGDGSFVQVCPTLNYKSLWARAENGGYRLSYNRFLAAAYPAVGPVPPGYHVDHLFNRKRALGLGLTYVRMVLVPQGVNMSHGGGYESGRTRSGQGTALRSRSIDVVLMMKLMGFPSPPQSGVVTGEMTTFAALYGKALGEKPSQILQEIANLTRVAARGR